MSAVIEQFGSLQDSDPSNILCHRPPSRQDYDPSNQDDEIVQMIESRLAPLISQLECQARTIVDLQQQVFQLQQQRETKKSDDQIQPNNCDSKEPEIEEPEDQLQQQHETNEPENQLQSTNCDRQDKHLWSTCVGKCHCTWWKHPCPAHICHDSTCLCNHHPRNTRNGKRGTCKKEDCACVTHKTTPCSPPEWCDGRCNGAHHDCRFAHTHPAIPITCTDPNPHNTYACGKSHGTLEWCDHKKTKDSTCSCDKAHDWNMYVPLRSVSPVPSEASTTWADTPTSTVED